MFWDCGVRPRSLVGEARVLFVELAFVDNVDVAADGPVKEPVSSSLNWQRPTAFDLLEGWEGCRG